METPAQSSNARFAAIASLIAAFVVVMVLIALSLGEGSPDRAGQGRSEGAAAETQRPVRRTYVVKPGDCCLSQIANKTGVDVDTLVRLNPHLDPQAIHSGDRVKLR
jgi:LysM domain